MCTGGCHWLLAVIWQGLNAQQILELHWSFPESLPVTGAGEDIFAVVILLRPHPVISGITPSCAQGAMSGAHDQLYLRQEPYPLYYVFSLLGKVF